MATMAKIVVSVADAPEVAEMIRELIRERDSARSVAVRLEQELAQALALGFEAGKAFAQDEAATERLRTTLAGES